VVEEYNFEYRPMQHKTQLKSYFSCISRINSRFTLQKSDRCDCSDCVWGREKSEVIVDYNLFWKRSEQKYL